MNKKKFLARLKKLLRGYPAAETENRLAFYAEMIDDRMEEGLSEREAVHEIGEPEEIAKEILSEIKEDGQKAKKSMGAGAKIFLVLGSPVWLSVLIAAAAVVFSFLIAVSAVLFSVFVCLFALLISLYAVVVSLGVSGIACAAGGVFIMCTGRFSEALMVLGAGCMLISLCIVFSLISAPAGKGIAALIKKTRNFAGRIVFKRRKCA